MFDKEFIYDLIFEAKDKGEAIIPIISFEGLPGSGKSTQIEMLIHDTSKKYGKPYFFELPTESLVGRTLKHLYADLPLFNEVANQYPWLNPLLLSLDFREAINQAIRDKYDYILISRGYISTYFHNFKYFLTHYKDLEIANQAFDHIMETFIKPTIILYLNIDINEAHQRVIKRNDRPLRDMDKLHNMKTDESILKNYLSKCSTHIPIEIIDANDSVLKVHENIRRVLDIYLDKHQSSLKKEHHDEL